MTTAHSRANGVARVTLVSTMAVFGAAVVVLVGCSNDEQSTKQRGADKKVSEKKQQSKVDERSTPSEEAATPPPAADAPVHQLTAREFYDAYKEDSSATAQKYRGSWVELTGEVSSFNVDQIGRGKYALRVTLVAAPKPGQDASLNTDFIGCHVAEREPWKKMSVGDTVTLKGTYVETGFKRGFDQCTIVKSEGKPTPSMTANELAKRYLADPIATLDALHKKTIVLTGKIARNGVDESIWIYDAPTILQGEEEVFVALHYFPADRSKYESLQPGDEVKIVGAVHVIKPDESDEQHKIGLTFVERLDLLD